MFGNPDWFRKKNVGWGLRPVQRQGWVYVLLWASAICVPFVALMVCGKVVESLVWVTAMMVALLWDVRKVIRDMDAPLDAEIASVDAEAGKEADDVLIIDEDTQPDPAFFATRSFDLHVRR